MAKILGIRRAISDRRLSRPKTIMESVQKYVFKRNFKTSIIVEAILSPMTAPKSSSRGIVGPLNRSHSPDSTYVCSKFDFYLILSCHVKFDASNLKRNCCKLTRQNRHPLLQNEFAISSPRRK
ncbi:hypothetical protein AVEN_172962-1 [Araneus ventricosus]|uniref:Uncharacterized protein n=1 Tax=Araneus ventricosus TaxID=182803 RepID=A0A4Y2FVL9_ARAVE|nr:hypothetical protein AVEN_172962-1 [Araneus ventricosus]